MNRNRILIIVAVLLVAMVALAVMNAGRTTTRPVEVVSVEGPVPPYTPGGPTVSVTLKNTGMVPITELTAALAIQRAGPKRTFRLSLQCQPFESSDAKPANNRDQHPHRSRV